MFSTAGAPHISVTPCVLDPAEDLRAVDLAQDHVGRRPCPVTAYSMPHPLQWNWGSVCRYTSRSLTPMCQPKIDGVEPQVAVGELHALGAGRRAGGVVDRGGGVLVGLPTAIGSTPGRISAASASAPITNRCSHSTSASESASSGSTSSTRAPECPTM